VVVPAEGLGPHLFRPGAGGDASGAPLPFVAVPQPMVKDFIPELGNLLGDKR